MWLSRIALGSFRRGPRRGPQSRLGLLLPTVLISVVQSSSSPAPPHGLQSPIGAGGRPCRAAIGDRTCVVADGVVCSVGPPESAHGGPELVKHALVAEVDGTGSNNDPPARLAQPD